MTLNQEQSDRITDLILAKSALQAEVERLRKVRGKALASLRAMQEKGYTLVDTAWMIEQLEPPTETQSSI